VGGYLDNLIQEYGLLARRQPLFARPGSKNLRYAIDDNFFLFWFRFVARYSYMLEIGTHGKPRELVRRDYNTFSGLTARTRMGWRGCCRALRVAAGRASISVVQRSSPVCSNASGGQTRDA
jgi:hypothetical protein